MVVIGFGAGGRSSPAVKGITRAAEGVSFQLATVLYRLLTHRAGTLVRIEGHILVVIRCPCRTDMLEGAPLVHTVHGVCGADHVGQQQAP